MAITSGEVAAILRSAIAGELPLVLADPEWTWARVYAGDIQYRIGGWVVTFFNDCDELDYVDSAESPDGRIAGCDEWCKESSEPHGWVNPLDQLDHDEQRRLETLLEQAT